MHFKISNLIGFNSSLNKQAIDFMWFNSRDFIDKVTSMFVSDIYPFNNENAF